MSPLQRKRIAEIIIEAQAARVGLGATEADRVVAKKHRITIRTLQRWRIRAEKDAELSQEVAVRKTKVEEGWARGLSDALREQIEFLRKAARDADPKDPQAINAVAQAMTACSEVAATWKMLDVRLSRPAGTNATKAGSAAAGSAGGPAGGGGAGRPSAAN